MLARGWQPSNTEHRGQFVSQYLPHRRCDMPNRPFDRRALRTRQALLAAFVQLLLSGGYEALTTAQISRRANVGRSTFYSHFASKEALLSESLKRPSLGLAECVDASIAPERLAALLDHFRQQHNVNRIFFADPIRRLWVRALAGLIEPRLRRGRAAAGGLPRPLLARTLAEMQIGLITHWLTGRFQLKSE